MAKKFEKTIPGHQYKIGLGVIQAEKMGKAASKVNETPRDFLKKKRFRQCSGADRFGKDR